MLDHGEIIECANALEPLPSSAVRLARLVGRETWDVDEVVETVSCDPALCGKLLRFANSALYGTPQSIGTVGQAVMRIGSANLLGIVIGMSVRPLMTTANSHFYDDDDRNPWPHSLRASIAVEVLRGGPMGKSVPGLAFTAAIIHDVGKLVLARLIDPELTQRYRAAVANGCRSFEAELEILSAHHAEVGGVIAQHWQLPNDLVEAIAHHHTPTSTESVAARAVFLGEAVARDLEGHPMSTDADAAVFKSVCEGFGIEDEEYSRIRLGTASRFESVHASYG